MTDSLSIAVHAFASGKYTRQAESLLEKAAGGIDLHFNADKMEYMCFKPN